VAAAVRAREILASIAAMLFLDELPEFERRVLEVAA